MPECGLSAGCGCQLDAPDHKHPGQCTELSPRGGGDDTAATLLRQGAAGVDSCGVANGDGSSCAASVLAQAWQHCPQVCRGAC